MSTLGKCIVLLPLLFASILARVSTLNLVEDESSIHVESHLGGLEVGVAATETTDGESDPNTDKAEEGTKIGFGGEQGFNFNFQLPRFGNQVQDEPAKGVKETALAGLIPGAGAGAGAANNPGGPGPKPNFETQFRGSWMVHKENAGVSAMHTQLMPNNKVIWYDTVNLGRSNVEHQPPFCRRLVGGRPTDRGQDCTAHAIEYDIETGAVRTLGVEFDPWCSSGGMTPTGGLMSTGGNQEGFRTVRMLEPCDTCLFEERPGVLSAHRWYSTQIMLENGNYILVGGRGTHNYEIFPAKLDFPIQQFGLPLLEESEDEKENNLYPFVNLLPDGNVFVFANYKSIILNPNTGEVIRNLPDLPGGGRNYPVSGMSALLPLDLRGGKGANVNPEVIVCGGNTRDAFKFTELPPRKFPPAFKDCGRLKINDPGAKWEKEDMPSPRVMGDMLILPTADILIINGAQAGTSAWDAADIPNLTPVLYSPNKRNGERFKELAPTDIPRMYHSTSIVLPDGQVLVAGSNTNDYYKYNKKDNPEMIFPTDLRVQKFSPPYLAPELQQYRPKILEMTSDKKLKYGSEFNVRIELAAQIDPADIKVTMYAPPFTTHGYSHNQRLLILETRQVTNAQITAVAPPSGKLAPPMFYLLFVVHRGVPSRGMWVQIA